MGARQSFHTDIDRRPRSNSTVETGIEVHGSSNRHSAAHFSHHQHDSSLSYDLDGDSSESSSGFMASLGLTSSHLSQSVSNPSQPTNVIENGNANHSPIVGGTASSAPSPNAQRHSNHHQLLNTNNQNTGGLRFSLRPSNRTSFLQALTGAAMGNLSSNTVSSSSSSRNNRDRHSVPLLHLIGRDTKCPMCHKKLPSDDAEVHLVMCFTRPRIAYNDDVLKDDKGECSICLEDMNVGDTIARLPCLCIYHKLCIDEWFKRKNCCPEHPGED